MVQSFVNSMFQHGLIPTVNKRTRVTRNTAAAIDHIITNSLINSEFKIDIIKTDIYQGQTREEYIVLRPGKNSYRNEIN